MKATVSGVFEDLKFKISELSLNQKVHEGVEFSCDKCGKDFAFKKGLRRHISKFHKVHFVTF